MRAEKRVYYDSSIGAFCEGDVPGSIVIEYDDETEVVELGACFTIRRINIAREDAYTVHIGATDDQWGKYPPGMWQAYEGGDCYRVGENDGLAMAAENNRIAAAMGVIERFGGIEGAHHKAWVIDQVVRALTGDQYPAWVKRQREGDDGPETYEWDVGIAP